MLQSKSILNPVLGEIFSLRCRNLGEKNPNPGQKLERCRPVCWHAAPGTQFASEKSRLVSTLHKVKNVCAKRLMKLNR